MTTRRFVIVAVAAAVSLAPVAPVVAQATSSGSAAQPGKSGTAKTSASANVPAVDPTPNAKRAPSGISDAAAYKINPGDDLEVYVWGDERLQRDLKVLPDGSVAFPLVGTLKAAGKSSTQLENDIADRLATQYRGDTPQVTVSVKAPTGLTVSVVGKVRSPGSFAPGRYITLLEAVALAGGPTDFADVNSIVILRKGSGRVETINGQLTSLLKGKPSQRDLSSGNPVLQPGDTVIVP